MTIMVLTNGQNRAGIDWVSFSQTHFSVNAIYTKGTFEQEYEAGSFNGEILGYAL